MVPDTHTANDNRFLVIQDQIHRDEIAARLYDTLDGLSRQGTDDAVLVEGLFLAMMTIADRSALGPEDRPTCPDDLARYHQLSRIAGDLDLYLDGLMNRFLKGLMQS